MCQPDISVVNTHWSLEFTFFFPFQSQVQNGPVGHRGEGEPSGIPIAMVLVPVFALTMVAAWVFMRYRQQCWKACFSSSVPNEDTFLPFPYLPPLPFPIFPSLCIANTWFKETASQPEPCSSKSPSLRILMREYRHCLKESWRKDSAQLKSYIFYYDCQ